MASDAEAATRIREGHPEGYLLAFANLYQLFAQAIMARALGQPHESFVASLPTVEEGVKGMAFIEAATRSNDEGGCWVKVPA
jgi:predicted dehydrogenase